MNYVIQIKDGATFAHPIAVENLVAAFPGIDLENLPAEFAPFERIDPISMQRKPYEVFVESYVMEDGVVKDSWSVQEVSAEDKAALRAAAYEADHPEGWIFNEEWIRWEPDLTAPGSAPDAF
jgi:hypothetical protein